VEVPAITIETSCDPCSTPPIVTGVQTTAADCDIANGTATIIVEEMVNDFVYTWPTPINENINSNIANNLLAGIYTVTISQSTDVSCYS